MTDQAPANTTPRLQIILAIVMAVFFVGMVVAAAKTAGDRKTYSPVSMGPVDAPGATSAQCTDITVDLPERAGAFRRVEVADPAPAGATAYRDEQGTELTVRCGVRVPDQYTVLSSLSTAGGASWLAVSDATPQSSLTSHYAVGGTPVVAVTSEREASGALEAIGEVVAAHTERKGAPQPGPYPLSDLPAAAGEKGGRAGAAQCQKFLNRLPARLAEWKRTDGTVTAGGGSEVEPPKNSATYLAKDAEPVVVRCGVEMPAAYEPGAQLTQIDEVPWFSEPGLARGSTSGRWFALGREQVVALAMPQAAGDAVITPVSKVIAETLASTEDAPAS